MGFTKWQYAIIDLDSDCINFKTFVFLAVYWSIWTSLYSTCRPTDIAVLFFLIKPPHCLKTMSVTSCYLSFCIFILDAPELVDTFPTTIVGNFSKSLVLTCPVNGVPLPHVIWRKNGRTLGPNANQRLNGLKLTFICKLQVFHNH